MHTLIVSVSIALSGAQAASSLAPASVMPERRADTSVNASANGSVPAPGPFQKLFIASPGPESRVSERLQATLQQYEHGGGKGAPKTKIVCGMVVITADPQVDPGMIQRLPQPGPTMHIRRIPPATCAE